MTRAQRVVRVGIWALLPLMLVGSLDLAVMLMWQYGQDRDLAHVPSPDGHYVATVNTRTLGCGFAKSRRSTVVFIERRFMGIKTGIDTPFCTDGEAAKVNVFWTDNQTLSIACEGCDGGRYGISKTNWGTLRYAYDLNR